MKKLIFLLLLAQTISFLYGDAGCLGSAPAHSYHGYNENKGEAWGMRIAAPGHTNCDCQCARHARAGNKCINCGHINVPKALTTTYGSTKSNKHADANKKATKSQYHKKLKKKQSHKNTCNNTQ